MEMDKNPNKKSSGREKVNKEKAQFPFPIVIQFWKRITLQNRNP